MTYRCQICGHEEEVAGDANDGPVFERSKVLGVVVQYESSLVRNMAEAEIRHVIQKHSGQKGASHEEKDTGRRAERS